VNPRKKAKRVEWAYIKKLKGERICKRKEIYIKNRENIVCWRNLNKKVKFVEENIRMWLVRIYTFWKNSVNSIIRFEILIFDLLSFRLSDFRQFLGKKYIHHNKHYNTKISSNMFSVLRQSIHNYFKKNYKSSFLNFKSLAIKIYINNTREDGVKYCL